MSILETLNSGHGKTLSIFVEVENVRQEAP